MTNFLSYSPNWNSQATYPIPCCSTISSIIVKNLFCQPLWWLVSNNKFVDMWPWDNQTLVVAVSTGVMLFIFSFMNKDNFTLLIYSEYEHLKQQSMICAVSAYMEMLTTTISWPHIIKKIFQCHHRGLKSKKKVQPNWNHKKDGRSWCYHYCQINWLTDLCSLTGVDHLPVLSPWGWWSWQ